MAAGGVPERASARCDARGSEASAAPGSRFDSRAALEQGDVDIWHGVAHEKPSLEGEMPAGDGRVLNCT
jgi:hypothetical protein